jgi:hypothetical protein
MIYRSALCQFEFNDEKCIEYVFFTKVYFKVD